MARLRRVRRARIAQGGFSLLEVLIVLAIIALVVAVVGPRLIAQFDRSKVTAAGIQARALTSAMETMRLDLGRYPSADEGLRLLVEAPASGSDAASLWRGPYLEGALPQDPWGRPYVYQPADDLTQRPRIESLGADGKPGGSGLNADLVVGGP
ncbi:MAG: type II secretion system major pseudopilin GspG [Alphaproteobacteria bacterium]|nr:type II secretion system major pseudopilin GspG [Alphaproteobacteria bacterium]